MVAALFIIFGIGVTFILYTVFKPLTTEEKEEEARLKESLDDDRIFDPETGVYISLEEAESGQWSVDDREKISASKTQITKEGKQIAIAVTYVNNNQYTNLNEVPDTVHDRVESSKTLAKYDDWSYSHIFKFDKGFLFIPRITDTMAYELQLLFFLNINSLKGHYYLREKESVEKVFDRFRKDDDLTLKGYESFTFRRSKNIQAINTFLKVFEGEKDLEIEIDDTILFIKTRKSVNIDDIKRIESIIQKIK